MKLRLIAFAAASGRIGMICLDGNELTFWKMAKKAASSPESAAAYAEKMIERYAPDWVIMEKHEEARYKGVKTKELIAAMTSVARQSQANCLVIARPRTFKNKYAEAAWLVHKHPNLYRIQIQRCNAYDVEPRATVVFEAIALADAAQSRPTTEFAAAM